MQSHFRSLIRTNPFHPLTNFKIYNLDFNRSFNGFQFTNFKNNELNWSYSLFNKYNHSYNVFFQKKYYQSHISNNLTEDEDKKINSIKLQLEDIVKELDKYIVGQESAKKAVAIAIINRRRKLKLLDDELRDEVVPKNVLMIGPPGCGKYEIAKRLAKYLKAPFIKVESNKFTEVGFEDKRHVNNVFDDLIDDAIQMRIKNLIENPIKIPCDNIENLIKYEKLIPNILNKINLELKNLFDKKEIINKAKMEVENNGIIYIDEVDKICSGRIIGSYASVEGFQRDLIPLIHGTTVSTKYGTIKTDNIIFIVGCELNNNPSDMLKELISRIPISVEIKNLTINDYENILKKESKFNLITLHKELFNVDNITLEFEDDAINAIAKYTYDINSKHGNIGARRLHSILERILFDISFNIPNNTSNNSSLTIKVSENIVKNSLNNLNMSLKKFITVA